MNGLKHLLFELMALDSEFLLTHFLLEIWMIIGKENQLTDSDRLKGLAILYGSRVDVIEAYEEFLFILLRVDKVRNDRENILKMVQYLVELN